MVAFALVAVAVECSEVAFIMMSSQFVDKKRGASSID